MPYDLEKDFDGCDYAVVKVSPDGTKEIVPGGCHPADELDEAQGHLAALQAAEQEEDRAESEPAPPKDQIEGSEENKPGSAQGKIGDIDLDASTETALQKKADEHNQSMSDAGRPDWTRVRVGALRSVYRRGAGAYSVSHRPGVSRGQWAMARVNAFLYLAKNGRPENPNYVGDFDLLDPDHPKYSGEKAEPRAINPDGYAPTQEMREEADRGLEWRREFGRGGTLVGVARARDISSGKRLPIDTVRRMHSYFARHEVDKKGQGFSQGEDGYPSAGRIAWALWGGDAGMTWAAAIIREASDDSERSEGEIMGIEFRKASAELRAVGEDGFTFEGMAALYDSPSGEGTTPEVIKPGAFSRSLAAAARGEWDVRAYADHNPEKLLGTTKTGTLELEDTAEGLRARIRLNPEVSYHRDLAEIVRTMGRSLGMSFGFYSTKANRVNSEGVRELRDVKLVEVSALTGHQPYYPGTLSLVAVRSLADETGVEAEDLRDAVSALLAGEIDEAKASLLLRAMSKTVTISTTVEIEEESGEDHPEEPMQPMPEEAPTELQDGPVEPEEESARKAECGCESGVPRSVREKQIELARLALR